MAECAVAVMLTHVDDGGDADSGGGGGGDGRAWRGLLPGLGGGARNILVIAAYLVMAGVAQGAPGGAWNILVIGA